MGLIDHAPGGLPAIVSGAAIPANHDFRLATVYTAAAVGKQPPLAVFSRCTQGDGQKHLIARRILAHTLATD